jgi:hypothetical protein
VLPYPRPGLDSRCVQAARRARLHSHLQSGATLHAQKPTAPVPAPHSPNSPICSAGLHFGGSLIVSTSRCCLCTVVLCRMPTPPAHHVYRCAGECGKFVNCWPYQAKHKLCPACLKAHRQRRGLAVAETHPKASIGDRRKRTIRGTTYWWVFTAAGWRAEHRMVWEQTHGRRLTSAEVIHHIDHDGLNNDPANLRWYPSKGAHLAAEHSAEGVRARMAGYPVCGCGERTAYGSTECWKCWSKSQTCPTCKREDRKMAKRDMCHGCYKRHRSSKPRPVST